VLSATDQPATRSALLTPNWRGCETFIEEILNSLRRNLPNVIAVHAPAADKING